MTENKFDLVVIGSGPAGYTGSIRAAQHGLKVACIEKYPSLGGTCLHVGCIPSKALLHISNEYAKIPDLLDYGIIASRQLDLHKVQLRKNKIVNELSQGIAGLFKKNNVQKFTGTAEIKAANRILIRNEGAETIELYAERILIATGSEQLVLPNIQINEKNILSSSGVLKLTKVPETMLIIGGGYIGLELGSVWSRFGSKVTIAESASSIASSLDKEISSKLTNILTKQGIQFLVDTKVESVNTKPDEDLLEVVISDQNGKKHLDFETVLVSVGRKPYLDGLGVENLGINLDSWGRIIVDDDYQTNIPNIYAVGDVIAGPMLAHKAEEEAVSAVEIMVGKNRNIHKLIPSVIYTDPEIASIGQTEEELKANNVRYKVGKFPSIANGRARITSSSEGFVKILIDEFSGKILGAHIISKDAGNMISEIAVAMQLGASAEDLAKICHPHPTLSEMIKEASSSAYFRSINF